ncbi:MAG: glycosyltransferase family 2 protein [Chloroflexota bacterium]|nr:glycosyltransferase family 2 protein [Chloroflexota bacterium]
MPKLSVIIPCYNGQSTIKILLQAILEQDFPTAEMEVIIADGMSTDETRKEIAAFKVEHPELAVEVIDNPKRTTPSGLNVAMRAAQGKFILRFDAHTSPRAGYISRCIAALEQGLGDNVGGVCEMRPGSESWMGRAIALALAHPLGVGDAGYRIGSEARAVDTVPFGAFRRSLIDEIGGFDESLLANEDYEFNVRVRQSGRTVWIDPEIRSTYVARTTLSALARQYWRYGYWKLRMLTRYPETFRWRQLSGAFVLTWLVLGFFSIWLSIARWLLAIEAIIYGGALLFSGVRAAIKTHDGTLLLGLPLAIATMHFSWGSGFLWSFVEHIFVKRKE